MSVAIAIRQGRRAAYALVAVEDLDASQRVGLVGAQHPRLRLELRLQPQQRGQAVLRGGVGLEGPLLGDVGRCVGRRVALGAGVGCEVQPTKAEVSSPRTATAATVAR